MADWFSKNYSWVFSGIGVAAISGSITLAVYLARRRAAAMVRKPLPTYTADQIIDISPRTIVDAYEAAPVLQRDQTLGNYDHCVISWSVRPGYTNQRKPGYVELVLAPIDGSWICVCTVLRADFPLLGTATSATPITVTGRIGKVEYGKISLEDAVLAFPKTDARMEQEGEQERQRLDLAYEMQRLNESAEKAQWTVAESRLHA